VSLTVAIYGGLGNQMFQYAMGRALALRHGLPLKLDLYGLEFDRRYRRSFELEHFRLPPGLEKVRRPVAFRVSWALSRLARSRRQIASLARPWLVLEAGPAFDGGSMALDPRRDTYVQGYWQDERYFLDCTDAIRSELRLAHPLSGANREIAALIGSVNAVALHVRRLHGVPAPGSPLAAARGPWCLDLSYYRRAVELVIARVTNPHFLVFSDEPRWARENLPTLARATFLENDRGTDREDLYLMSLCRHHVVANSSFSWWGAWLARADGQMVVAPKGARLTPTLPEGWLPLGANA